MQVTKDNRLGTENITRLMISLAIPSVLAQIVNVLYNIVDRIYIGRIPGVGAVALTGVGVTFPIITIISAFSGFASGGGAPLAAIALGQGDRKRAERILGNCVSMLLFFTVILMVFFFVFRKPLLYVFGASDNTIGYSSTYISIYLLGTVFVELAVGLNTFISAQARPDRHVLRTDRSRGQYRAGSDFHLRFPHGRGRRGRGHDHFSGLKRRLGFTLSLLGKNPESV